MVMLNTATLAAISAQFMYGVVRSGLSVRRGIIMPSPGGETGHHESATRLSSSKSRIYTNLHEWELDGDATRIIQIFDLIREDSRRFVQIRGVPSHRSFVLAYHPEPAAA